MHAAAADVERIRLDQLEASRQLEALSQEVERQNRTIHHRIDKLEIKVLLYAFGGGAGGAVIGKVGQAAASTLIGG